eukprot:gene12960-9271_t
MPRLEERSDIHSRLKKLSKEICDNGGISRESLTCFSDEFVKGVESQLEAYRLRTEVDQRPFLEGVDWAQLGTTSSLMNIVGILLLSSLKVFVDSNHREALDEKKRSYRAVYQSDPVDSFETLYLLDRYIGKITDRNKVAFQAVASVLDGLVYDKMSSSNPSLPQCRHFVAIEHIADMFSDTAVARTARDKVWKSIGTKVTRREAEYLTTQCPANFEPEVFISLDQSESDIARMSKGPSFASDTP